MDYNKNLLDGIISFINQFSLMKPCSSFIKLKDGVNIMEILCQLDDTEFSFDNITTEHGNNFTILFENWDKILSALQNYYQLVLFQNQFPQDFQLMEMLNDDERVYDYVLYILLESDKKQVYAQYLGNLKENEQISLIQFYELTKNTVKEGQLQQFVYNKLGSGSPMRNDVDMEDYKFKFDELLHQLTIKENELNELAKAKQEVNVELEKKKKKIDGFAVKEQNWKEKELDYIEKIEKLEEKIETSESTSNPMIATIKSQYQAEIAILKNKNLKEIQEYQEEIQMLLEQINSYKKENSQLQMNDKANQKFKDMYYELANKKEQQEYDQSVQGKLQNDNEKLTTILQKRTQELMDTQQILKDQIFKYEIQISGQEKQIELLQQQLIIQGESKDKEINEMKQKINERDRADSSYSDLNFQESARKGLGMELIDLIEQESKTISNMKEKMTENLDDWKEHFDQQDIQLIINEKEKLLNICKEMSAQIEEYKIKNQELQSENDQLESQILLQKEMNQKSTKIKDSQKEFANEIKKEKDLNKQLQQKIEEVMNEKEVLTLTIREKNNDIERLKMEINNQDSTIAQLQQIEVGQNLIRELKTENIQLKNENSIISNKLNTNEKQKNEYENFMDEILHQIASISEDKFAKNF